MAHRSVLNSKNDPTFTAKSRSTWEIVRRVSIYLKPYKLLAFGTIAFALLSLAFTFAFPKLTRQIIDDAILQKKASNLTAYGLALLGAFFFRDLFNSLRI